MLFSGTDSFVGPEVITGGPLVPCGARGVAVTLSATPAPTLLTARTRKVYCWSLLSSRIVSRRASAPPATDFHVVPPPSSAWGQVS